MPRKIFLLMLMTSMLSGCINQGPEVFITENRVVKIRVEDTAVSVTEIQSIVERWGGVVTHSHIANQNLVSYRWSWLNANIPVDNFQNALKEIKASAATVIEEHGTVHDHTDAHQELQSLKEAEEELIELMTNSEQSVIAILAARDSLEEVREEINLYLGRIGALYADGLSSTLHVEIHPLPSSQ